MQVAQDIRFSFRQLRRSPAFAVTTILTLGLGIGATTAIFSLVNAVVLRPLPFPEQEKLMWLQNSYLAPGASAGVPANLSYPDFFDWRAQNQSFAGIASYRGDNVTLTGLGNAQQLPSAIVSSDFFRVLGVHPAAGRDFLAEDEKKGTQVAILSHELWQSTFGGASDIAGRAITLNSRVYTVAGVMPAGFAFPIQSPPCAIWTTVADDAVDSEFTKQRGAGVLEVIGRLKPGVPASQARADLEVIVHRLAVQYPDTNQQYNGAVVQPELEHLVGDTRPALRLLFAAVSFVLLIACVNVAGLLLARGSRRRSDIALRAALGARRIEIICQILVECVFLALCGGALGILLSSWILEALLRFVPENLPRADRISVDGGVFGFALLVSILTGLLFGVLPAWRLSRLDPLLAMRESGRGMSGARGQNRLHNWLVVAETALGLVLLAGSGLFIRSFVRVLNVDAGFDPHKVLAARFSLPANQYSREQRIQFYGRLFERLAGLPGVQSVAAGFPLPLSGSNVDIGFTIEGHPAAKGDEPSEQVGVATGGYFRTMRIPVTVGREFTPADDTRSKLVMVINAAFARKYFPGENPIGKRITPGLSDGVVKAQPREVVGVVGNVKRLGLTADAEPQYYLPWEQAVIVAPPVCIRAAGDPNSLIGPLRAELANLDPGVPLYRVGTLDESVYKAAAHPRFQTLLLTCFAGMALLLSAIGLYSALSYMVALRTVEIGVRMALGARREDVLRWILGRGIALAVTGLVVGLCVSAILARYMNGMLYKAEPFDLATFTVVSAILLGVSLIASSVPAYRAARVDPMTTLRDQ